MIPYRQNSPVQPGSPHGLSGLSGFLFPILCAALLLPWGAACGDGEHASRERVSSTLVGAAPGTIAHPGLAPPGSVPGVLPGADASADRALPFTPRSHDVFRLALQRGEGPDGALASLDAYREARLDGSLLLADGETVVGVHRDENGSVMGVHGTARDGSDWMDVGGQPWEYGLFDEYDDTAPGPPLLEEWMPFEAGLFLRYGWLDILHEVNVQPDGVHWSLQEGSTATGEVRHGLSPRVEVETGLGLHIHEGEVFHGHVDLGTLEVRGATWAHAHDRYLPDGQGVAYEHILTRLPAEDVVSYRVVDHVEVSDGLALLVNGQELEIGEAQVTLLAIPIIHAAAGRATRLQVAPPIAWDASGRTTSETAERRDDTGPIHYRVQRVDDRVYRITTVVDGAWLRSPERQWPVTIDPTMESAIGAGGIHGYWHEPFNQYWRWSHTEYYLTGSQLGVVPHGSVIASASWYNRTNFDYTNFRHFTRDDAYGHWVSGGMSTGFPAGNNSFSNAQGENPFWTGRSGHYENFVSDADSIFEPAPDSCIQNCGRLRPGVSGGEPCSCRADCFTDPAMDCCDDVMICGGGQFSCYGNCGGFAPGGCRCDEACLTDGGFEASECCPDIGTCYVNDEQEYVYSSPTPQEWSCVGQCGEVDRSVDTVPAVFTFTNRTMGPGTSFVAIPYGAMSGSVTGIVVNATLDASTGAQARRLYVGLQEVGITGDDYVIRGASASHVYNWTGWYGTYVWSNGASTTPGTVVSGTVNPFPTALAAANLLRLRVGNHHGDAGGTWSGNIELLGATMTQACSCDEDCSTNGNCCGGSASTPIAPAASHYQPACDPPDGYSCLGNCGDDVTATVCVPNGTYTCSTGQFLDCACDNCGGLWSNGQPQPPCCDGWSDTEQVCTTIGPPGYCPYLDCLDAVCGADSYCCNIEWDSYCTDAASTSPQCAVSPCSQEVGNSTTGYCNVQPTEQCTNEEVVACSCSHDCHQDGNCCDNKDFYCGDDNLANSSSCLGYCGGNAPAGCSCDPDCTVNCCPDVNFYCIDGDSCVGRCDELTTSQSFSCRSDCGQTGQPPCAPNACQICGAGCAAIGDDIYQLRAGWGGGLTGGTGTFAGFALGDIPQNLDGSGNLDYLYRSNESLILTAGQHSNTTTSGVRPEYQFVYCPSGGSTHCEIYRFDSTQQTVGYAWPSHPRTRLRYFRPLEVPANVNQNGRVLPPGIETVRMHYFDTNTTAWNDACERELQVSGDTLNCERLRVTIYNNNLTPIHTQMGCGNIQLDGIAGLSARNYVRIDQQPGNRSFTGNVVYNLRLHLDDGAIAPTPVTGTATATSALSWSWTTDPAADSYSHAILPGSVAVGSAAWATAPTTTNATSPLATAGLQENACYTGRLIAESSCATGAATHQTATWIAPPVADDFTVVGTTLVFDPARVPGLGDTATCNGVANQTVIEAFSIGDGGTLTALTPVVGTSNQFALPPGTAACTTIGVRYRNRLGVASQGGLHQFEIEGDPAAPAWVTWIDVTTSSIDWRWASAACTTGYDFGNSAVVTDLLFTDEDNTIDPTTQGWTQTGLDPNTCYDGFVRSRNGGSTSPFTQTTTSTPAFAPVATLMPAPTASSFALSGSADLSSVQVSLSDAFPQLGAAGGCGLATNQSRIEYQATPCETVRVAVELGNLTAPASLPGGAGTWASATTTSFDFPSAQHHCWQVRVRYRNMDDRVTAPSPWVEWRGWDLTPTDAPAATDAEIDRIDWSFVDTSLSEDYFQLRSRLCLTYGTCASSPGTDPSGWTSGVQDETVPSPSVGGTGGTLAASQLTGLVGPRFYGNIAYESAVRPVLHHSRMADPVQGVRIDGDWSENAIAFTRAAPPEICGVAGGHVGVCDNWQNSRDLLATALNCDPEDPQGQPWTGCDLEFRIGRLGSFESGIPDDNISNNACTRQAGSSLVREEVEVDGDGDVVAVLSGPVTVVENQCLTPGNESLCNENFCGSQNPGSEYPGRYGFGTSGTAYWPGRFEGKATDAGLTYGSSYRYTMRYYNSDGIPSEATTFLFHVGCQFGDEGVCAIGVPNTRPLEDPAILVDINAADSTELQTLPGIGASRATSIIDHRDLNGPFETPENLMDVSGIGSSVYQGLCDQITASGVLPTTDGCGTTIVASGPGSCTYPGYDGFERCNGVDWSCTGDPTTDWPDVPLVEECYEGPAGTVDVGLCQTGLRLCVEEPAGSGSYAYAGECEGQVLPEPVETCDANDTTCSGDPYDVDYDGLFCGGYVSEFAEPGSTSDLTLHSSVVLSSSVDRVEAPDMPGTFVCTNGLPFCAPAGVGCSDPFVNQCGGCAPLTDSMGDPVTIGDPCDECPDQVWECDGLGGARCSESFSEGDDCVVPGGVGFCAQGITVCDDTGFTCVPTYVYDPDVDGPADFCDFDDIDCDGDPFNDARVAIVDITGFAMAGVGDINGFAPTAVDLAEGTPVTYDFDNECDLRSGDNACGVTSFHIENFGNDTISADALASIEFTDVDNGATGLWGEYFIGTNFEHYVEGRNDSNIDFDWGGSSPLPALPADGFSVRWRGTITAPTTGTFTFHARTDDGVRLVIGGLPVITHWEEQSATFRSGTVDLVAGQPTPFAMFYFESDGSASALLEWQGPGVTRATVPASAFTPYHGRLVSQRVPLGRAIAPGESDEFHFCFENPLGDTTFDRAIRVVIEDGTEEQADGLACIGTWRPDSLDSTPRAGLHFIACGDEVCDGYDNNLNGEINEMPEACGNRVAYDCVHVTSTVCGPGTANGFDCPHPEMRCNPDLGYCLICTGLAEEAPPCEPGACALGNHCHPSGACIPGCVADVDCPSGESCLDGACLNTEWTPATEADDVSGGEDIHDGPAADAATGASTGPTGSGCAAARTPAAPTFAVLLLVALGLFRRRNHLRG